MSSRHREDFDRAKLHSSVPGPDVSGRSRPYHNAETPYRSEQVRNPQPASPAFNVSNLDNYAQAYQQHMSNEPPNQTYDMAIPRGRSQMSRPDDEQHQKFDTRQDTTAGRNPPVATRYDPQSYQYHSSTSIEGQQTYSPQPTVGQQRRIPYPSTPIQGKTSPLPPLPTPPPSQRPEITFPAPSTREMGMQHPQVQSQRYASSYSPSPANTTLTPDRSTFGSPMPPLSPNSLKRELEGTKEYSENVLTQLLETERLLEEREAEIAELRGRLTASGSGDFRQQGSSLDKNPEVEELHRQLRDQDHALRAAQNDLVKAQSLADHQQRQAERYSKEYFALREHQSRTQQQPQENLAQMEEARRVTEFYMQKADQLSRDNMNIAQQNRKLTEDLAAAQRNVQQQGGFVGSMRQSVSAGLG